AICSPSTATLSCLIVPCSSLVVFCSVVSVRVASSPTLLHLLPPPLHTSAVAGVNTAALLHRLSVVPLASASSHRASCLIASSLVLASPQLRLLSLPCASSLLYLC
ncbi:hypothetical protein HN51_058148, partial [Arachis hypogaea]